MFRIYACLNGQRLPASNAKGFKPYKTRRAAEQYLATLNAYAKQQNPILATRGKVLSYVLVEE